MTDRAQFTRGRQRDVLGYMFAYPNKHITIAELEKHFKGQYNRTQLMSTMAHTCNPEIKKRYNLPIERITTGVWRVVEKEGGEPELKVEEPSKGLDRYSGRDITCEILKERDTYLIVEDVVDGKIYKMTLVG
jgi:hypothetical protein